MQRSFCSHQLLYFQAESVPDSMVKQLRSNLDGLEQLNNILLIGRYCKVLCTVTSCVLGWFYIIHVFFGINIQGIEVPKRVRFSLSLARNHRSICSTILRGFALSWDTSRQTSLRSIMSSSCRAGVKSFFWSFRWWWRYCYGLAGRLPRGPITSARLSTSRLDTRQLLTIHFPNIHVDKASAILRHNKQTWSYRRRIAAAGQAERANRGGRFSRSLFSRSPVTLWHKHDLRSSYRTRLDVCRFLRFTLRDWSELYVSRSSTITTIVTFQSFSWTMKRCFAQRDRQAGRVYRHRKAG